MVALPAYLFNRGESFHELGLLSWPIPVDEALISVSIGNVHTCGLSLEGTAICWWNDLLERSIPQDPLVTRYGGGDEDLIHPPEGEAFIYIDSGDLFTCGVRSDGSVICWGVGSNELEAPERERFRSVSCGSNHVCGVRIDGSLSCWGQFAKG